MKSKRMILLYVILLSAIIILAYIRLAPSDRAKWHQDPETAASTGRPNQYILIGTKAPDFDMAAADLVRLVNDFILSQNRVARLAGGLDTLMVTYVERSLIMGYPDYITVKIIPLGPDQSKLEVFSRSRFGHSDLGVNQRRIDQWVGAIRGVVTGR